MADRTHRALQTAERLVRRRGPFLATAFSALAGLTLVVLDVLPAEHRARAILLPAGPGRAPPAAAAERALAAATLDAVAAEAGLREGRSIGEALVGAPHERGRRLRAAVEPAVGPAGVERVVVLASASTPAEACRAADALAHRLAALDAPEGATGPRAGARLAALRLREPLLRDAGLEERLRALRVELAADRVELGGLRGRLQAATDAATRLEEAARREAEASWRLARDEAGRTRPRPAEPAPAPAVAQLEAELERLRASLTAQHPDVKRLQRQLQAERQKQPQPPPEGVLLFSDDDPPPPDGWLQRAPSYPAAVEARARLEAARVEADAREQQHTARLEEEERLGAQAAAQVALRLEEARLADEAAREPAPPAPHVALRVVEQAAALEERSPWAHLPAGLAGSALLALVLAALVDLRDRAVRDPEDLAGLGVPLLGALPDVSRPRRARDAAR